MHILKPKLSKAEKAYIAKECHRILEGLKSKCPSISLSNGLCSNAEYDYIQFISFSKVFADPLPFNEGIVEYMQEKANKTIFKNKKRMRFLRYWAKKHK